MSGSAERMTDEPLESESIPLRPVPGGRLPNSASAAHAEERAAFDSEEFFGPQRSRSRDLPAPAPLLTNLTTGVIEVLAGVRDLEQLNRWVTDEVYAHLLKRVVLASKARLVRNQAVRRPQLTIGTIHIATPRDGVIEAVVLVHQRSRSRAVAIRLEGIDRRWRATAISVL